MRMFLISSKLALLSSKATFCIFVQSHMGFLQEILYKSSIKYPSMEVNYAVIREAVTDDIFESYRKYGVISAIKGYYQ